MLKQLDLISFGMLIYIWNIEHGTIIRGTQLRFDYSHIVASVRIELNKNWLKKISHGDRKRDGEREREMLN